MGMLVIIKDWGVSGFKKKGMELSTGKILEETLVQSALNSPFSRTIT
jgi:hypothetical protein